MPSNPSPDVVLEIRCGNCNESFWCLDLAMVGYTALGLHEHWNNCHAGNIHGPSTTIYTPEPPSA